MTTKKTVLFSAPMCAMSGYSTHSRQVAKYLLSKEEEYNLDITMDPVMWGNCSWILDRNYDNGLLGKVFDRTGNRKQFYDVAISLKLPNEWSVNMNAISKIGITAGVETTKCNPEWLHHVNMMDSVIVPSQFTKEIFLNSGQIRTPIEVVGESFPDEFLNDGNVEELKDFNLTTPFNFLVFGQFTGNNPDNDRKNLFYTIKWLSEVFANSPDVGIVLKTNLSRNTKLDKGATKNLLMKVFTELKKQPNPKFHLLHGELNNKELKGLYTHPKIKGLISLSRGEGFGLPLLEAAACGLPVIATNWSAHTEFLNLGNFTKIDYQLKPIHPSRIDNQIFMEGSQWAEPSEIDFKNKIVQFKNEPQKAQQWAKELKSKIIENYNSNTIFNLYDKVLGNFLKD